MSEMRLRHKKPINSYVGQANYDSNEAHDEDFARNAFPNKRTRLIKQRPTTQQTKKYAEILCQFVNAVNLDYRNHSARFPQKNAPLPPEINKQDAIERALPEKNPKDQPYTKTQEVVSKQQQKIRKSEYNANRLLSQHQKNRRDHPLPEDPPKPKELKQPPAKVAPQTQPEDKTPRPAQLPQPVGDPTKFTPQMMTNMAYVPMSPLQVQQIQQMQQLQQLYQQNPMFAMNAGIFPMYSYGMTPMMNFPLFQDQQLKQDPSFMMQNYMASVMPSPLGSNGIPFSKLPFNRSTQVFQHKKEDPAAARVEGAKNPRQPQNKPTLPMVNDPGKAKPEGSSESRLPAIDFKRASSHHVAIAYNIHFNMLKEKGLLSTTGLTENMEKLDPTLPAKRIRLRKASDSVANVNDSTAA